MEKNSQDPLSNFFTMIADPVRLQILQILLKNKIKSVSDLIKETRKPQTMISYHLSCLKDCGLIDSKKSKKDARIVLYSLHEFEVVERLFLIAENFLLKHEGCKNHPACKLKNN